MMRLSQATRTRTSILSLAVSLAAIPFSMFVLVKCQDMLHAIRATAPLRPPIPVSQLHLFIGLGLGGIVLFPLLILLLVFLQERHLTSYRTGIKIAGALVLSGTVGQTVLAGLIVGYMIYAHTVPGHAVLSDWLIVGMVIVGVDFGVSLLFVSVPYGLIYLVLWLFPRLRNQQTAVAPVGMGITETQRLQSA